MYTSSAGRYGNGREWECIYGNNGNGSEVLPGVLTSKPLLAFNIGLGTA